MLIGCLWRFSEMIQVGCWAQSLACNKQGICDIAYFYYPRSEPSLETRSASFQACVLSTLPLCLSSARLITWRTDDLHCESREHSGALVRWMRVRVKSKLMQSYPELWNETSTFWSQTCHLYSTNQAEGSAANQTYGNLLCTPSLSWHCQGDWVELANLTALPRTKNGTVPLIGLLNGFLLFWRQKESPLPLPLAWLWWELNLVISLVIKAPQGMASCPVVFYW